MDFNKQFFLLFEKYSNHFKKSGTKKRAVHFVSNTVVSLKSNEYAKSSDLVKFMMSGKSRFSNKKKP